MTTIATMTTGTTAEKMMARSVPVLIAGGGVPDELSKTRG
jgi:hypothetical protein